MNPLRTIGWSALTLLAFACKSEPKASETKAEPATTTTAAPSATGTGKVIFKQDPPKGKNVFEKLESVGKLAPVKAKPVAQVPVTPGDPEAGQFTLEEATAGLEGNGQLLAEINTDLGTLSCELFADKAPITVANFVGLARGTRAWQKGSQWVKQPLYDGTKFHRVIKEFMIQGGDPLGNGQGGPGFVIPDEVWEGARHSEAGLLCMANKGPNTNGSQFFVLNNMALHLDGGYTIFGKCGPVSTIDKIASVPTTGDRPKTAPVIKNIKIKRGAEKPSETKPTETKPSETKPTETKPTETKPTETKPSEPKPFSTGQ
jgi:peptidyl-prolyl cis-trans isomerase A (cyclophilin A)